MTLRYVTRYVTLCYVMLCYVMLCYAMLCQVTSRHVTSRHVTPRHATSRQITSDHVRSRQALPRSSSVASSRCPRQWLARTTPSSSGPQGRRTASPSGGSGLLWPRCEPRDVLEWAYTPSAFHCRMLVSRGSALFSPVAFTLLPRPLVVQVGEF